MISSKWIVTIALLEASCNHYFITFDNWWLAMLGTLIISALV